MAKSKKPKGDRGKKANKGSRKEGSRKDSGKQKASSGPSAADALIKLIESPLVAELLAVGATAALAAIAEQGLGKKGEAKRGRNAVKAAGKAAAAAMGRRITTEVEEIRKAASKAGKAKGGEAAKA